MEELNNIKIDTAIMKKDISQLKSDTKKNGDAIKEGFDCLSEKIDNLDKRFSGKWVETWIIWAGRIIGGTVLLSLITLIADLAFQFSNK